MLCKYMRRNEEKWKDVKWWGFFNVMLFGFYFVGKEIIKIF